MVKQRGAHYGCVLDVTGLHKSAAAEEQLLSPGGGGGGFLIKQTWDYFANICLPP